MSNTRKQTRAVINILIMLFFLVVFVTNVHAATVSFATPTPANSSTQGEDAIPVNISSTGDSDHYTFVDFDNTLRLWMRFDDRNSSGDPTDIGTNQNNGSLQGGATINTNGKFGDGLDLNGINSYIAIPDDTSLRFGVGDFTYSLWFNPREDATHIQQLLCKRVAGAGNYEVQIEPNGLIRSWIGQSGSAGSIDSTTNVDSSLNQWYHVVITRGGGTLRMYVNGVEENNMSSTHNVDSTSELRLGQDAGGSTEYFNGTIDGVTIFNRTLSQEEIAALYNASATQYTYNFTGLSHGTYKFKGYIADTEGNMSTTETRFVTITNAQLQVFDDTDTMILLAENTVNFSANYTNITSGAPITSGTCNITFDDTSAAMIYNATTQVYEFNRTFSAAGVYFYNVICSASPQFSSHTIETYASIGDPYQPTPGNVTVIKSERWSAPSTPVPAEAQGGNLTEIDILFTMITSSWQGFYGNVTGRFLLRSAQESVFYEWNTTTPHGEVYATRASDPNFATVSCANSSAIAAEEAFIGHNISAADSVTNTFNATSHPAFEVGNVTINQNTCQSTNIFDNTGRNSANFYEVLLVDAADNFIYTGILDPDQVGFDNNIHDFEILVGESGADNIGTTPYYFFIEIA